MPRDSNGVYSLPSGYLAVSGQTIAPSQHNSPLEDIKDALTASMPRNGAAPMTDDLPMGGNKVTGLGDATSATDALNRQTADSRYFGARTVEDKSSGYTALAADRGVTFRFTAAATLSLTAAATLTDGWNCIVIANGGTVTVDGSGSETINGATTLAIPDGSGAFIICDGTRFFAVTGLRAPQPITDVASAATTDIGAVASENINVTGTTTITSFGTATAGTFRRGTFAGALTLTHNATSLILPGSANITTAAGDTWQAVSLGSGNWRVVHYTPASGQSVSPTFSKEYVSAEQSISNAGGATLTHGLGRVPKLVEVRLICKTAEVGYSVGDEVPVAWGHLNGGPSSGNVSVALTSTEMIYRYANSSSPFTILNRTTGGFTGATNANWRMVLRAYA